MKAIFESEDPKEIKMMSKAHDMSFFLFELINNSRDSFSEKGWKKILELMDEYSIDIDDLTE